MLSLMETTQNFLIFFNFKDNDLESRKDKDTYNFEDIIFYHFAGSGKPWKTNGV